MYLVAASLHSIIDDGERVLSLYISQFLQSLLPVNTPLKLSNLRV